MLFNFIGVLRLYVQAVGDTSKEAKPIWQLYNNQGPTWNYAQTNINENTNFNIVFEGIWGPNRASGSIGIDDISFYIGNCSGKYFYLLFHVYFFLLLLLKLMLAYNTILLYFSFLL